MALEISDRGIGNCIEIADNHALGGEISLLGDNSTVKIAEGCRATKLRIEVGSNAIVEIGHDGNLSEVHILCGDGCRVTIGASAGFVGHTHIRCHEATTITIGDGVLCASDTSILSSDMHSICDLATGQRVNPADDVWIESRVWLAQGVCVLKGSNIGSGSVIGAKSVVAGSVPRNVVAVGSPARVVRENVCWHHALIQPAAHLAIPAE